MPNALEGYLLIVYGTPGKYALGGDEIRETFLGDLDHIISEVSSNIAWFIGMDPDTVE